MTDAVVRKHKAATHRFRGAADLRGEMEYRDGAAAKLILEAICTHQNARNAVVDRLPFVGFFGWHDYPTAELTKKDREIVDMLADKLNRLFAQPSTDEIVVSGDLFEIRLRLGPNRSTVERWADDGVHVAKEKEPIDVEEFRGAVRAMLRRTPEDYGKCHTRLSEFRHVFQEELGATIQEPMRRHLRAQSTDTYEEKRRIATWLNEQLRELGLAIRNEDGGQPAILVADSKNTANDTGRFRLEIRNDSGKKIRTHIGRVFPELELMADVPRLEPLISWNRGMRKGRLE